MQSGAAFSPPPLPWQAVSHQQQYQQLMMSPMLQQSVTQHQSDVEDHGHTSYSMLRARRPPTGASPNVHDSPAHDFGVRKPTFTKCSGVTPSHLRRRSMSADLEHTDVCETSITYPASPGDQQAWTQMSKVLPPQAAGGFVRLNSGIKTVFSPNQ